MKVGDLVRLKRGRPAAKSLGKGLIMSIMEDGIYGWVWFQGWQENNKWILIEDLEIVSKSM